MTHEEEKVNSDGWPLFLFPSLIAILFIYPDFSREESFIQYILFLWRSSQNSYLITKAVESTESFSVDFPRFEDNRTILKETNESFIME